LIRAAKSGFVEVREEGVSGGRLGAGGVGEVLGVDAAYFLDELDEGLERFVFGGEDDRGVDGGAGHGAGEDVEDLFADVDADVFLSFVGAGAQVGSCDAERMSDEFGRGAVRGFGRRFRGEDIDCRAGKVTAVEGVEEGGFVNYATTRDIEYAGAGFHGV